jgi:hypothetical protein
MMYATARVVAMERMLTVMMAAAFHQTSTPFIFLSMRGEGLLLTVDSRLPGLGPRRDWRLVDPGVFSRIGPI